MKSNRLDVIFFVFISVGLLLLFYLVYQVLTGIQEYKELVKLLATLTFPIPFSIYWGFIFAARRKAKQEITFYEIKIHFIVFLLITMLFPIGLYQYDQYYPTKFYHQKLIPVFMTTVSTFAYALNYLSFQNITMTSVLSGILLGLAIYFFTI